MTRISPLTSARKSGTASAGFCMTLQTRCHDNRPDDRVHRRYVNRGVPHARIYERKIMTLITITLDESEQDWLLKLAEPADNYTPHPITVTLAGKIRRARDLTPWESDT